MLNFCKLRDLRQKNTSCLILVKLHIRGHGRGQQGEIPSFHTTCSQGFQQDKAGTQTFNFSCSLVPYTDKPYIHTVPELSS